MSDNRAEHDRFEELAAGYALDALDEDEERVFRVHLVGCERCQALVADLREVAAEVAGSAGGDDPDPGLRDRIVAAALEAGQPGRAQPDTVRATSEQADGSHLAPVVRYTAARHRVRPLVAAAAAVVVALAGVGGGLLLTSGGTVQPPTHCSVASGCSEVVLTSALSHRSVATVIVSRRSVWVRPVALPVDDTSRQIYVLWEIVGRRAPRAVGAFDVAPGASQAIAVGSVASGPSASAFAISLERGRSVPRSPSATMALGRIV